MRRHLFIAVIFLLAGAVVNVAVAWGCAVTADPDANIAALSVVERIDELAIADFWLVRKGAGVGVQRIAYTRTGLGTPTIWKPEVEVIQCDRRTGEGEASLQDSRACPPWAPWPPEPRPAIRESVVHLAVGLPLKCLHATNPSVHFDRQLSQPLQPLQAIGSRLRQVAPASWKHALVPPNGPFAGDVLPYYPIWPGLAVNTAFYATVLWLLICVSLALRRFIRMKRGLCPKCTYPMGESAVCTECGRELPKRAGVVTT